MLTLRLSLLGSMRLARENSGPDMKVTRTMKLLLAYLLIRRQRPQPREILVNLLWGDQPEDQARSCLSTHLWRLRSALEPNGVPRGTYVVLTPGGEVRFNWDNSYWLDIEAFEQSSVRQSGIPVDALTEAEALSLEQALQLYTGELLEGYYEDWIISERERLELLYVDGLTHLMRYYAQHQLYDKSLACAQTIFQHDPLREEIHREIMRYHLARGQRALAIQQYRACREVLTKELGIGPMEETQSALSTGGARLKVGQHTIGRR